MPTVSRRAVYAEVLRLLGTQVPFAVATVVKARGSVPAKAGSKMVVTADGRQLGTVGGAGLEEKVRQAATELIQERRSETRHYDLANWRPGGLNSVCGGSLDILIEYHAPQPHLLLVGGGHCAQALAELCIPMDYDLTVVDDRPEFASQNRFPTAVETFVGTLGGFFEHHDPAGYSHCYIQGYSHEKDTDALEVALRRFTGFIGVIGSRAKRHSMEERLLGRGLSPAEVARFRCPIGLAIEAQTPHEIAVSVLGEIIQERNEGAPGAEAEEASPAPARATVVTPDQRRSDQKV